MAPKRSNEDPTTTKSLGTRSSPRKARIKPGAPKTLESFFRNPPATSFAQPVSTFPPRPIHDTNSIEDIEDDDTATFDHKSHLGSNQSPRKRSWNVANEEQPVQTSSKFVKLATGNKEPEQPNEESWTEQYSPRNLNELAVHHKKVADVRNWLESVLGKRICQRLLVLRGAAGTAKTTTVALLARELNCELVKWEAPDTVATASGPYESASAKFADFLSRASSFGGLEFTSTDKQRPSSPAAKLSQRQLLLVEDFPTLAGSSMALNLLRFREQLLQYLAANVRSSMRLGDDLPDTPVPLILVISESILSSTSPADNFTAHRLLGPDILQHPGVSVIDFNPVAPTIITKALKLVVQKHTRHCGRAQKITPELIKSLSEVGDVRNAVSTLEYITKDPTIYPNGPGQSATASKLSRSEEASKEAACAKASSLIALREGTIGLFHAIGKILYNKRSTPALSGQRPHPDLDVENLVSTSGSDVSTLLSALHENYALSCFDQYGDNEATMESMSGCLDAFSDADILCTFNGTSRLGKGTGVSNSAIEGLRQEELALHAGVMGTQAALPYPVKRQSASGHSRQKGHGDHHRMYYPTDLKLRRQKEDVQFNLNNLLASIASGRFFHSLPIVRYGRLVSQPGRLIGSGPKVAPTDSPLRSEANTPVEANRGLSLGSGHSAKQILLLDRLPYIKQIYSGNRGELSSTAANSIARLEDLVSFQGLKVDYEEDDDDDEAGDSTRPVKVNGAMKKDPVEGTEEETDEAEAMQKLVLEQDPIIDDFDD